MSEEVGAGGWVLLASVFLASTAGALSIASTYSARGVRVLADPSVVWGPLAYLVLVLALSAVILLLARSQQAWLVQGTFLAAVFAALLFVLQPLLAGALGPDGSSLASTSIAVALTGLLLAYPEWYVLDTAGLVVSVGSAAVLGVSFTPVMAALLLVLFSLYDTLAVYYSGHMLELSKHVRDLKLPILLVVPPRWGYSFLDKKGDEYGGALILGIGDLVLPGLLAVSAAEYLPAVTIGLGGFSLAGPLLVAACTAVGTVAAFGVLSVLLRTQRAHAGMLVLNAGALTGFLLSALSLYGLTGWLV